MKIVLFDPPGSVLTDLSDDPTLPNQWSQTLSAKFDQSVDAVTAFLNDNGGGTCQFYNPITHGSTEPDLSPASGDITWNGFPKRFSSTGPGHPTRFAEAERPISAGQNRLQDEYLEWFVNRNDTGKITSIHFTCEAWDYFEFLGAAVRSKLVCCIESS